MEKSRVFAVGKPQGLESIQRRAHVRVDLERVVRIRSLTVAGPDGSGVGKTVNIGAGGVQFTTAMPLRFGEQLRLALVLTSRDIVVAGGPVVRIEEVTQADIDAQAAAGSGSPLPRVAVRFDSISEVDRERIACHILSAQRQKTTAKRAAAAHQAAADASASASEAAAALAPVPAAAPAARHATVSGDVVEPGHRPAAQDPDESIAAVAEAQQ